MAQLTIRQLDDTVAARLRERAAAAGRSMEHEVREILTAACADPSIVVARLGSVSRPTGDGVLTDSAEIVRKMRDERGGTLIEPIVVDASVALKWIAPEDDSEIALRLIGRAILLRRTC